MSDLQSNLSGFPPWARILLSALTNGIITAGTALLTVAASKPADVALSTTSLILVLMGGLVAMAKDIHAYVAVSPLAPNDAPRPGTSGG